MAIKIAKTSNPKLVRQKPITQPARKATLNASSNPC